MMDFCQGLTLNEEALAHIPPAKRPVFIFEWLRFLDKVLIAAQKNDIKECQKKLVEQLMNLIQESPGPPTRKLIARSLATLFSIGDTFLLFDTVNKCNDILKNKDDSPSFLPTKLGAICCLGTMYEKLGRMMGRSYEETVQILLRSLRNTESQTRIEILLTLEKVCRGMGSAISNIHKEIYKAVRHCLIDRVMAVRCAAIKCFLEMLNHAPFLYTTELESLATLCFRAFDGSNYEVRYAVAKLLGSLVALTQTSQKPEKNSHGKNAKTVSLDEALGILMSGFLRGGVGFLKGTGEMIKGSSGINREVRVGVTHAYVILVQILGNAWIEKNMKVFLTHVLYLVANPKAATSHVDAVYSRKCVNFILRSVFGKMLNEKAQASACKEITMIVVKEMNTIDFNPENAKDLNQETLFCQHLLVCALHEIGNLILSLGTAAHELITDRSLNLLDTTVLVLLHPCQAARLAAAWCLRCICVAVPSQITPLIGQCVAGVEEYRASPEAISGFSGALAAALGGVPESPLGVPHNKGKIVFNTAEELLRSASQNSRVSMNRTQAGWLLIGAITRLGVPVVRGLLPRMLLLWRNSFPRSTKELESEKARGDAFTWQVTLQGRAGALSAMHSLLQNCPELITDDIVRKLLAPIESALVMLINISSVLKSYGQQLKAPSAMVRLRLYETLLLIPPQNFESSYTHLLRMLVTEFTLIENPANTTTSQLKTFCHGDDSVILGTWLQETDHRTVEDQLQLNSAAGSGALEHDPCYLYRPITLGEIPGPLPLGVAVIDASIFLFGQIFPRVANKHRLQMIDHFSECIKHTRSSRQEAVQINVFTALLSGLKGLSEAKMSIGQEDIRKATATLIINTLTSPNPILRCAAGEAVGRMAQVVGDGKFTAELAQASFDRLKTARDVASRTGHSLALGCLHRYVGGMGSSQHLNTSVSILLALAQDQSSPVVQVWALHALALIADSGGPMFRGYFEPTLSLALKLLLNVPESYMDVHQCIGKVLCALITTIGPELQGNTSSICAARTSLLSTCAIMQDHSDALVQAEAIACLQQLHLFAPRHVNLSSLVPTLCRALSSSHLLLRKAAISCLRQLTQREAREVCERAMALANESRDENTVEGLLITDTGLPGVFFSMLDTETDPALISDIHDTLISTLQMLAADNLSKWLGLCKDVLTVATESTNSEDKLSMASNENENDEAEVDDDEAQFHAEEKSSHLAIQPRWPTRVFAAQCVRRIITACEASNRSLHFDLVQAKENQIYKGKNDYLVLHISDLIRMAFIAATSITDPLRLEGLKTLQEIIEKFAKVPEPEFPGHLLLEQFQAQVGAALRPAFAPDTSSHITAAACEVCSTWIGSNVARDLNDLRRVHQLMVSSLTKLHNKAGNAELYNESLATLEKLAILKAWAEVYIVAMNGNENSGGFVDLDNNVNDVNNKNESLLTLVQPELLSLSQYWSGALKDYGLLSLPPEFSNCLPHDGGMFYTNDTMELSRIHYITSWPPILHAATLWLNSLDFVKNYSETDDENILKNNSTNHGDKFYLLFGICIEALCRLRSTEHLEHVRSCLQALHTLLNSRFARKLIIVDNSLGIELCNILHRLVLTMDDHHIQMLCMEVLKQVMKATKERIDSNKLNTNDNNEESINTSTSGAGAGTGTIDEILPGKSIVFAILEVCLCLLVRQLPSLIPSSISTIVNSLRMIQNPEESGKLIAASFVCMEILPTLCTPREAVSILPTVLYLTTTVIKETASKKSDDSSILAETPAVRSALHCLKTLITDRYCKDERYGDDWQKLLQSSLARIIDLAKTGDDNSKLDEVTMILAISVFILHAPSKVVTAANLQYPCINLFRQCLQNQNNTVQVKCLQTLKAIFVHQDRCVATPYIHSLAPVLIEHLYMDSMTFNSAKLNVTIEAMLTIEVLVDLAHPQRRMQILGLFIPILVKFLIEEQAQMTQNKNRMMLHEASLQRLMNIGLKNPQDFKRFMSNAENLRLKLEKAIRNNQQKHVKLKSETNMNKPLMNFVPTIKLKTDFSNFS